MEDDGGCIHHARMDGNECIHHVRRRGQWVHTLRDVLQCVYEHVVVVNDHLTTDRFRMYEKLAIK